MTVFVGAYRNPVRRGYRGLFRTRGGVSLPTLATIPNLWVGVGDSILGGNANYWPFFNRGMGDPNGWTRYVNKGRPGQYSQVVASNFAADCIALNPYAAVIACGGNDRGGAVQTIQAGTGNCGNGVFYIRQMIQAALDAGVQKIVACPVLYRSDGTVRANEAFINNTVAADIQSGMFAGYSGRVYFSDTAGVLSDPTTGLTRDPSYYNTDFIHPTDKGGRLVAAKFAADLVGFGLVQNALYPWSRNQSTADARSLMVAGRGTFQGTPQGSGAAFNWGWTAATDGLTIPSVVTAPAGLVGSAQRLTIGAGAVAGGAILQINTTVSGKIGSRIAVIAHTTGANMETTGANAFVKFLINGSNLNMYAINATGTMGSRSLDGATMHYAEAVVPAASTNLNIQIIGGGNPGASAATIDLYDVLVLVLP